MQVQKECGLSNGCSMYLLLILVVLQLRGCLGVSGVSLGVSTYGDQVYAGEGMHHAHYASTTQITHEHADTTQTLHVHIHPIITSNPIPSLITP